MSAPYVLEFVPRFEAKPWGGRHLTRQAAQAEGRETSAGTPIGEVWEIAEHPAANLAIANGPLAGRTLTDARNAWGRDALVGPEVALTPDGRFPLIVKRLDTTADLSIQVHPPDTDDVWGKTEAWYVERAEPGARVGLGLAFGWMRQDIEAQLRDCASEDDAIEAWLLLRSLPVDVGDAVLNRAGVIHAVGAGLGLVEVQQATHTTYRLFDYGRGRPLHVDEGLAVARLIAGVPKEPRPKTDDPDARRRRRVSCEHFQLDTLDLEPGTPEPVRRSAEASVDASAYAIVVALDDPVVVKASDESTLPIGAGRSVLIPAACAAAATVHADHSARVLVVSPGAA